MNAVTENELKDHQKEIGGKRVTLDGLEANIKKVDHYVHPDSQLTICIITLMNGFTVTGESACADPAMFNADIGKRISEDNAKKKIWPLMGYALKQELFLAQGDNPDFQERVRREEQELGTNIGKLEAFVHGGIQFDRLTTEEQMNLKEQLMVMRDYRVILRRRIQGFS